MLRAGLLLILLTLLILPPAAVAVPPAAPMSAREVAQSEAEAYLNLLDRWHYTDAWRVSSPYLQSRIPLKEWRRTLKTHREPLGRVRARRLIAFHYQDRYETAPVGVYLYLEFLSTFGGKERIERLIVVKDGDGRWRVADYRLR